MLIFLKCVGVSQADNSSEPVKFSTETKFSVDKYEIV